MVCEASDSIESSMRGYTADNVVPACTTCNLMKKDMPAQGFVHACWSIVTKAAQVGVQARSGQAARPKK